jgi:hypothetical protein
LSVQTALVRRFIWSRLSMVYLPDTAGPPCEEEVSLEFPGWYSRQIRQQVGVGLVRRVVWCVPGNRIAEHHSNDHRAARWLDQLDSLSGGVAVPTRIRPHE